MPLLTVDNISMSFGQRRLLDGVSFRVNEGDRIAFIGDNGAGKSTLFKVIKGVYTPDEGKIILHGNTIVGFLSQNMDEQDLSGETLKPHKLINLEQEISALEFEISAHKGDEQELKKLMDDYASATAQYEAAGGYDYEYRLSEALAGLGISYIHGRDDFSGLSGGEKMRVCLARLIVERPDILLLDEPTNHLDMEAAEWLEGFLNSYGGAVFVITHDRHFIDSVASRVIELDGGSITEYRGNYSDYKEQKEAFLKTQAAQIENLEAELEHQLDVKQTMLSHRNISGYHQREKMVDKLEAILEKEKAKMPTGYAAMNFRAVPVERTGASDKILIQADSVAKKFDDADDVLFRDINFELKANEKIFFCGPNGCGKTTLLTMLLGRSGGFEGTVLISGGAKCGYMGQFVPFEDDNRTCFEELIASADLTNTEARSLLARFGFKGDDAFKQIKVLSGGERSRLYLCCLLNENPEILFLDEPTNHLDINSREILEDAIKLYNGAVCCVSHDRFFIDKCADKILGFNNKTAELYDKYEYYRKSVKAATAVKVVSEEVAEKKQEVVKAEEAKKETPANTNVNKSKLRKLIAQRRERIRQLEKEIAECEEKQAEIEARFTSGASEEDYREYADVSGKLDRMYDEFFTLSAEEENDANNE